MFDTEMRLAAIRQQELLQSAARSRRARGAGSRLLGRRSRRHPTEGA